MSPVATLVKLGSTALLLSVLEDEGVTRFPVSPQRPVAAFRAFATDVTMRATHVDTDGRAWSAWDYQDALWDLARRYVDRGGGEAVAGADEVELILTQWREMLDGVRDDPASVADRVDWAAKQRILEGYRDRYGLGPRDARLRAIDLQYHDVRLDRSLAARVGLRQLHSEDVRRDAVAHPPTTTRAYFRGECVARYPDDIVSANWDSIVFDVGQGPLQRIPMMDPTRGTRELVARLFDDNSTALSLVNALNG